MTSERSTRSAAGMVRAVRALHLGRWTEARARLLPRLVPDERAGPLWRRPRCRPAGERSPVVVEVGIDVDGGIVRLDEALLEAWAVDEDHIWRTALANAAGRPRPHAAVLDRGSHRFRLVVGDAWTTGLITQPARLTGAGRERATCRGAGDGDGGTISSVLVAAPRPETLIVAEPTGSRSDDHHALDDLVDPLLDLAADIAALHGEPALPLAALLVDRSGSFPAGSILG